MAGISASAMGRIATASRFLCSSGAACGATITPRKGWWALAKKRTDEAALDMAVSSPFPSLPH